MTSTSASAYRSQWGCYWVLTYWKLIRSQCDFANPSFHIAIFGGQFFSGRGFDKYRARVQFLEFLVVFLQLKILKDQRTAAAAGESVLFLEFIELDCTRSSNQSLNEENNSTARKHESGSLLLSACAYPIQWACRALRLSTLAALRPRRPTMHVARALAQLTSCQSTRCVSFLLDLVVSWFTLVGTGYFASTFDLTNW